VLLAVKSMGRESAEAWRSVLDGLLGRGLRRPDLVIVDGGIACWHDLEMLLLRISASGAAAGCRQA
jgi:hypothetical protein